ncbi:MAG: hypothetical protein AB2L11_09690 [Syntrophobacteraceae bacterium]
MRNILLSIPFLFISAQISGSGEVENHILTPFGAIDISFQNAHGLMGEAQCIEVGVGGDVDTWLLDDSMPGEFRSALVNLIGEIVRSQFGLSMPDCRKVSVCFKGSEKQLKFHLPSGT